MENFRNSLELSALSEEEKKQQQTTRALLQILEIMRTTEDLKKRTKERK